MSKKNNTILVADAGSSTTDWALVKGEHVQYTQTPGIHPLFIDGKQLSLFIDNNPLLKHNKTNISVVYFYGTGCASEKNKTYLEEELSKLFTTTKIFVHSDILGAARSLLQDNPGIACILGTGTNCCRYDGKEITENSASLGYILGDEGSGSFLGKELLRAYYYKKLPQELATKFKNQFELDLNIMIDKVYRQKNPNRYLSGFTGFMYENKNHPFIQNLIEYAFKEFVENHIKNIMHSPEDEINCTGSIAWYFQKELKEVCQQEKIVLNRIIQSPIKGLIGFHQKKMN